MGNKIYAYLAGKIKEDLLCQNPIDDDLLEELNKYPQIDYIRNEINNKDIDIILKLAGSQNEAIRTFTISLLSSVKDDKRVKEFIINEWEKAHDYRTKNAILWRLLDYPDIDILIHKEIYDFIKSNWKRWIDDSKNWFGGSCKVLEGIKNRLLDGSVPETKKWVYLSQSLASSDINEVRNLLSKYENSNKNPFVSTVIQDLKKMLAI